MWVYQFQICTHFCMRYSWELFSMHFILHALCLVYFICSDAFHALCFLCSSMNCAFHAPCSLCSSTNCAYHAPCSLCSSTNWAFHAPCSLCSSTILTFFPCAAISIIFGVDCCIPCFKMSRIPFRHRIK